MKAQINASAVRRTLCTQIDEALTTLGRRDVSDADIHGARKCIKKARATLRLIRDALPRKTYRRANTTLRDAARPLSTIRDARILIETHDRLQKQAASGSARATAFRRALDAEIQTARSRASSRSNLLLARRRLRTVRREASQWRITAQGWAPLGEALERVYLRGQRMMKAAKAEPSAEGLHEWRKQVKYLWHQLQLLERLAPDAIGVLADQTHKLSDYLGDDHDLAVLRAKARQHPRTVGRSGGARRLNALIDRRQAQLRGKAFVLGKRIYQQSPEHFVAGLRKRARIRGAAAAV